MLPFGIKYSSSSTNAFDDVEDDNDDESETTTTTRSLTSKSTTAIDQLLTNNLKRKEFQKSSEKEHEEKKKKQRIEKESDSIKELQDRIQLFNGDDEDEWEEEQSHLSTELDETTAQESSDKEEETSDNFIQFTIPNHSDQPEIDSISPKQKRTVHRKTKDEISLNFSENFTLLLLYFNFQYQFIEFIKKHEEIRGTIQSLLEESQQQQKQKRISIEMVLKHINEIFEINLNNSNVVVNIIKVLDEPENILKNLSNKKIENWIELILVILIALIYNQFNIRYCTRIEIPTSSTEKSSKPKKTNKKSSDKKKASAKEKNEFFSFENCCWIEIYSNDNSDDAASTGGGDDDDGEGYYSFTKLSFQSNADKKKKASKSKKTKRKAVNQFEYSLEVISINSSSKKAIEQYYQDYLKNQSSDIPIVLCSFDFLSINFNYIIRNVTSKYLKVKSNSSTLVGYENFKNLELLMNELFYDLNHELLLSPSASSSILDNDKNDKTSSDMIVHVIDDSDDENVEMNDQSKQKKKKDNSQLILNNLINIVSNSSSNSIGSNIVDNNLIKFIQLDELIIKQLNHLILHELPTTQQECQTHPIYTIEKYIGRYEALYPNDLEPVGKLKSKSNSTKKNSKSSKKKKNSNADSSNVDSSSSVVDGINIYLRENVQPLHTRSRWLRDSMLVVKSNEKPYKIVKASKFAKNSELCELFGEWQTEPYQVPIVTGPNDEIPKSSSSSSNSSSSKSMENSYELWSPKFLPIGCAHISTNNEPLKGLTVVARRLGIDYSRAMVGFDFKNKRSIPKYDGIIVHEQNEQKLRREYVKYQQERLERLIKKKNERIKMNWSKLVRGLLAREYVSRKYSNRKEGVHLHDVVMINGGEDEENGGGDGDEVNDENTRIDGGDNEMSDDGEVKSSIVVEDDGDDENTKSLSTSTTTGSGNSNSNSNGSNVGGNVGNTSSSGGTTVVQRVLASGKIVEFEQI